MSDDDVPSAYARSPMRPSPRGANNLRKLIAAAIILGAAFACWRMLKKWNHVDNSAQLARVRRTHSAAELVAYAQSYNAADEIADDLAQMHASAKAKLANAPKPHGLDPMLDGLLADISNQIAFDAGAFTNEGFDAEWSKQFSAVGCAAGFDDAFYEVLKSDIVKFDMFDHPHAMHVAVSGKLTPNGQRYRLPRSDKDYPGIKLSVDVRFGETSMHVDVQPGEYVEFHRVAVGGMPPDDRDVTIGLVEGACEQAGLKLIEALTGLAPLAPKTTTLAEDCAKGFHCREAAAALAATDRDGAAELYEDECRNNDESSCLAAAALLTEPDIGLDDRAIRARMMIESACMNELPKACAKAGALRLRHHEIDEALVFILRACDLGDRSSCADAVPLLAKTPFAAGAAAVARRSCTSLDDCPLAKKQPVLTTLLGAPLGTDRVVDVRWGQWDAHGSGEITAWVASTSSDPPYAKGHFSRSYAVSELPPAIPRALGMATYHAVLASPPRDGCTYCMKSGRTDPYRASQCVCVLTPRQ